MKIYLLTSNKYTHVCPVNIHFLNKYWPDQDITLVGYDKVTGLKNLPYNVTIDSLGPQTDFPKWSDALAPYFESIPEDYFVLIFDDHILLNKVDKAKMTIIEEQFRSKKVDKAMIGGGVPLKFSSKYGENLLMLPQGVHYRASLHPAVWMKKYLLNYLKPDLTSWDFELKNDPVAMFDGAKIINYNYNYPESPHPFSYLELFNKGIISINEDGDILSSQPSQKFFDKKDIQYIWSESHQYQRELQ